MGENSKETGILKSSILRKTLVKAGFLLLIGISISGLIQFYIYSAEFRKIRKNEVVNSIELLKPNLARAIWQVNEETIGDILAGIVHFQNVKTILYTDSINEISLGKTSSITSGGADCSEILHIDFAGYLHKGQIIPEGNVAICISYEAGVLQIVEPYLKSVLPFLVTVFVLLAVLWRTLWKDVVFPIIQLSGHISRREPIELFTRYSSQAAEENDEIDLLIYELKSQSSALMKERAVIEASFPEIDEAIVQTDHRHKIIRSNAAFFDIFQLPTNGTIANLSQIIPVNVLSGEQSSFEYVTSSGKVILATRSKIENDRNNSHSVFIMRDETERRRLQNIEAHSSKMVALGTLSSSIAHDYNNVLAIILGQAEVLQLVAEKDPLLDDGLRAIIDAASRGSALSKQLLTFARKRPLRRERISAEEVIGRIEELARAMLDQRFEIFSEQGEACAIEVDVGLFEAALVNIIANARDAMPQGGRIYIGWRFARELKKTPCVFFIRDSGFGMSQSTISRIQEPFFTTKKSGSGTGLGMAMVSSFVQQASGILNVRSQENAGSVFEICLPIATPSIERGAATTSKGLPTSRSRGSSILVLEDEAPLRSIIVKYLEKLCHSVDYADGLAQLSEMDLSSKCYDLVICDGFLVQSTALDIWKHFEGRPESNRFLIMSGNLRFDAITDIEIISPVLTLEKPFRLDDLSASVDQALLICSS